MHRTGKTALAKWRPLLAMGTTLVVAACGTSSPSAVGGSPSGDLGPGDGDSTYLSILVPGNNGNTAGGFGLPVTGLPAIFPSNFNDQATLYGDISYAEPGLTANPCTPPTDISQHVATSNQVCNYFKQGGLTPDTVVSSLTLDTPYKGTVTIQRDGWGVPFITAATRQDAMYGIGYAQAQDRLWLMDILRNFGRGQLSKFLGPAQEFFDYDASLAVTAGYSEDELTAMIDAFAEKMPDLAPMFLADLDADLAGINAYIATLSATNAGKIPPEYAELKNGGFPPADFTRNDIVASIVLLQSIFAVGGGAEVSNAALLQQLDPSITGGTLNLPEAACKMWRDLRHADDPDATRTTSTRFSQSPATLNESCPQTLPAGTAIWDVGSYQVFDAYDVDGANENIPATPDQASITAKRQALAALLSGGKPDPAKLAALLRQPAPVASATATHSGKTLKVAAQAGTAPAKKPRRSQLALSPYTTLHRALSSFGIPQSMSNWLAISGAHTVDGHPIAMMGPQIGYIQPHMVWEYAVHTNGGTATDFAARGVAMGTIPYILIGRGVDYAWSPTSNDSDIVDTRVSRICNMDGSTPSLTIVDGFPQADGYLYDMGDGKGPQCRRFYKRQDSWTAKPTLASVASGGPLKQQTVTRNVLRTHYGPVFATATVKGEPVVISLQRSNYFDEATGASSFALVSTPTVHGVKSFQRILNSYSGVFNWLYVDKQDIGFRTTGFFPKRDKGESPELPSWGDGNYEWDSDRAYLKAHPDYFEQHGGDVSFPARTTVNAVDNGPLKGGYYEFPGFLSLDQHPHAINPDQGYLVNWNNSPAAGWWAADNRPNWGPIHRVDTEPVRIKRFLDSGRKFDVGNVAELMTDAGYVDLRGQELLPLLLQIMAKGTLTADQTTAATLMQDWLDGIAADGSTLNGGTGAWIDNGKGLGAWRRSRTAGDAGKTTYDNRPAVVLMDAWYLHLMDTVTPQLAALDPYVDVPPLSGACLSNILLCRQDAPRAQGSAYEFGWYQPMYRMLQMALDTPGHHDYQALRCAGSGTLDGCRAAVLDALDAAISDLGGVSKMDSWNGKQLTNMAGDSNATVEAYDAIVPSDFSSLPANAIPWQNRPSYEQLISIRSGR